MTAVRSIEPLLTTFDSPISGAAKHDDGKPPLGMIPRSALIEEAYVMGFGAEKYDRDNWRKGMAWSRLIDASFRHLAAFNDGEDFDPETGLHHLAHARCCMAFLIEYMTTHPELDDRHTVPASMRQRRSSDAECSGD